MANPSIKNGYFPIANELAEQLALNNIPGNEMRIIWVVWRKTWGWKDGTRRKDADWISYSQLREATGMKQANVVRSVSSLVVKRLLVRSPDGFGFNQNYNDWVVVKRLPPVVKRLLGSSQKATEKSSQKATNKRKKETITKEKPSASQSDAGLIVKIIDCFEGVNELYVNWYRNLSERAAIDRLLVREGFERVEKIVKLLPKTNAKAYFPTITTPKELERDWAKLRSKLEQEKNKFTSKETKIAFS